MYMEINHKENNEILVPLSTKKTKSSWLRNLFGKKTKRAILCGNLSVLVLLSCAGTGIAETEIYQDLSAENGGAIYVDEDLSITNDTIFVNNSAEKYGGAIFVDSGKTLTLTTASFFYNSSLQGGGAIYNAGGTINNLATVNFIGNSATGSGGAISNLNNGELSGLTNAIFIGNKASSYGGAIFNNSSASIGDLSNVDFIANSSSIYGGAILNNTSATIGDLAEVNFIRNESSGFGGAINSDSAVIGAITDAKFIGNLASDGGAIMNRSSAVIGDLTRVEFVNNEADNCGAIYNSSAEIGNIKDSNFVGNQAKKNHGGAIYSINSSKVGDLENISFVKNTASSGGAIYKISGEMGYLKNVNFIGNTAGNAGGAVQMSSITIDNLDNVVFVGNTAASFGGAIYKSGSDLTVGSGSFVGNTATTNNGGAIYNVSGKLAVSLKNGESLLFAGNLSKDSANSIYLQNSMNSLLHIDLQGNSVLDMRDQMAGTVSSYSTTIEKEGNGTWKLGGGNSFTYTGSMARGTTINIKEGTLYLYRTDEVSNANPIDVTAKVAAGSITLAGANTQSSFNLATGATLAVGGGNSITANNNGKIILGAASTLGFDLGYATTNEMLKLTATTITVGNSINIDLLSLNKKTGTYTLVSGGNFIGKLASTTPTLRGENLADSRAAGAVTVAGNASSITATVNKTVNNEVVTWTGATNDKWGIQDKKWNGTNNQFLHGDIVNFTSNGAGTIKVNDGGVQVAGMYVSGNRDYIFEGGSITANKSSESTTLTGSAVSGKLVLGAKAASASTVNATEFSGTVNLKGTVDNYFADGVDINSGTLLINDISQLGTTLKNLTFNSAADATNIATLKIAENGSAVFASASSDENRLVIAENKSGKIELEEGAVFGIVGNITTERGGAIHLANGSKLDLVAADGSAFYFVNNSAQNGAAIFNYESSKIGNLRNVNFISNSSIGVGGAIYNFKSEIGNIEDSSFIGNSSGKGLGGGAICNDESIIGNLTNVSFSNNSASIYGGAIVNYKSTIGDLTNISFTANEAPSTGGAIDNHYYAIMGKLTNVSFNSNTVADAGGAIFNFHKSEIDSLTEVSFIGNTANNSGGAIANNEYSKIGNLEKVSFISNEANYGGAISNTASAEIGDIIKASFVGNVATFRGGAIANDKSTMSDIKEVDFISNTASDIGGAVYNYNYAIIGDLTKVNFIGNEANYGGALVNLNYSEMGGLEDVNFINNTAVKFDGGALYNNDNSEMGNITNAVFSGNKAGGTILGDLHGDGGAIYNDAESIIGNLTNVSFTNNEAGSLGGAIYNNYESKIGTITNASFSGNSAVGLGGAILNCIDSEIGDLIKVDFIGNTAGSYDGEKYSGGAIGNYYGGVIGKLTEVNFSSNTADGNGGAIFNSIISVIDDLTEVSFIGNKAGVAGGAIWNDGTMTISSGIFTGNLAAGEANSIYNEGTITIDTQVDTDAGIDEKLFMLDPMTGDGGTITKTGEGTWYLGGSNKLGDAAQFKIEAGTLYLYKTDQVANPNSTDSAAMVKRGDIIMGDDSTFAMKSGSALQLAIEDKAHIISASTITLDSGSQVGVDYNTAFVTSINDKANDRHNVLVLDSSDISNESKILSPAEGVLDVLEISAYDYYNVEAKWNQDKDVLSLYLEDSSNSFNPDRGGSHLVRAPLALALNNPTNEVIINRQKALFTDKNGVFGDIKQKNRHFWGTGFYNFSKTDQHHQMAGAKLKTPGFALGYDDYIGEKQFLGIAVTAAWPDYNSGNASVDGNDIRIAVYGGAKLNHNWELSYMAGYGWADIDQDRHYRGYKYNSDGGYDTLSFSVGLAKQYKKTETSFYRPYVHYEYMNIDADGYQESGEGEYGLGIGSKTYDVNRVRVGFDYVKQSKENENRYWRAGLFWQGQYGDTTPKTWTYFNSNPGDSRFLSYACSEDRDSLGVTVGWGMPIGKNSDFHLSYTGLYGSKTDTQDFSMTFVRRF